MKLNTEATNLERLRVLIGGVFAVAGFFAVAVVGAFFGYTNGTVWIVGLLLIGAGLLLAGSARLVTIFQDLVGL